MSTDHTLFAAVAALGQATGALSGRDMGQPFRWRAHQEGVRFALIGSYHELRALQVALEDERALSGPRLTRAQRALAPYHAAYRELQALLLDLSGEHYEQRPAPGSWSVSQALPHMLETERMFYALIRYGAGRQQQPDEMPAEFPREQREALAGPDAGFRAAVEAGRESLLAFYDAHHERVLDEFSALDDSTLEGPSIWWEEEPLSLQYRLHRFDAHLRQHAIQIEQALEAVRGPQSEAQRLLRTVYQALAAVESACFGAPDLGLAARQALAAKIGERADAAANAVAQAEQVAAAVAAGDEARVRFLLEQNAGLVDVTAGSGLSLVEDALRRGDERLAQAIGDLSPELHPCDVAALGRLELLQEYIASWPGYVTYPDATGETPLDKARRFNRQEIIRYLAGLSPQPGP
jgi:uncharacterized damage-inducible protein DinB